MNIQYWRSWFKWAQATALGLAKSGDLLGLTAFLGDLGNTVECLVNPFETLAACFKGKWFQIAGNVYKWATDNRDPLAEFRHDAEAMRNKWTANLLARQASINGR